MPSASMSTMRACGSNPPLRPSAYFRVLALTIPCRTPTEPRLPIPRGFPSNLSSTRRRSFPFSSMTNRGRRSRNAGSMYVSHRSSGSRMWPSASITLYARAIAHPSNGNEDRRHILLRPRRSRTENVRVDAHPSEDVRFRDLRTHYSTRVVKRCWPHGDTNPCLVAASFSRGADRLLRLVRSQEGAHLVDCLLQQLLGLSPWKYRRLGLRRQRGYVDGRLIGMRRRVIRHHEERRLARSHELA